MQHRMVLAVIALSMACCLGGDRCLGQDCPPCDLNPSDFDQLGCLVLLEGPVCVVTNVTRGQKFWGPLDAPVLIGSQTVSCCAVPEGDLNCQGVEETYSKSRTSTVGITLSSSIKGSIGVPGTGAEVSKTLEGRIEHSVTKSYSRTLRTNASPGTVRTKTLTAERKIGHAFIEVTVEHQYKVAHLCDPNPDPGGAVTEIIVPCARAVTRYRGNDIEWDEPRTEVRVIQCDDGKPQPW